MQNNILKFKRLLSSMGKHNHNQPPDTEKLMGRYNPLSLHPLDSYLSPSLCLSICMSVFLSISWTPHSRSPCSTSCQRHLPTKMFQTLQILSTLRVNRRLQSV